MTMIELTMKDIDVPRERRRILVAVNQISTINYDCRREYRDRVAVSLTCGECVHVEESYEEIKALLNRALTIFEPEEECRR